MSQVIHLGPGARMLTTREVASRLGVSLRTVQLWVEADILPAARTPGGHRRIPYNAVEALALSTGLGGDPLADQARRQGNPAAVLPRGSALDKVRREARCHDVLLVADDPQWQAQCASALEVFGSAAGIECRKDGGVVDEIPAAYKNIDAVMAHQSDLVEMVHTLRQVVCIKG